MERKIERKESFFSMELAEGEEVKIFVGNVEQVTFIVPYDCLLNSYIKKETIPIQFK